MKGYFVHAHVNSAAVISSPVTHSKWYTFRGDDINICHTFLFCVFSCLAFLNACSSKRIFLLSQYLILKTNECLKRETPRVQMKMPYIFCFLIDIYLFIYGCVSFNLYILFQRSTLIIFQLTRWPSCHQAIKIQTPELCTSLLSLLCEPSH